MTITLAQTTTLLATVVFMHGVSALVWATLALAARIAPRASLTMAAANACAAAALTLMTQRGAWPDAWTHWPAHVLNLGSFALLSVAVPGILTSRLPWKPAAAVVAVLSLVMLALPEGADMRWQTRLVSGAGAAMVLLAGVVAWRHLQGLHGRRTPAPLALPLFLIALLLAVSCASSFVAPGHVHDLRATEPINLALLWLALLVTLLQNATLAFLVMMRLIRRIERLLARDPLTDALNRGAFDQALAQAHAWFQRGRGYALVMIDMDRFKQLNDTLGHAAGDAALQWMVNELRPCLREVDRFGRLGGEEFCALLPDTDIAGAALVAERMRALVNATPLRWLEQDWPLSASLGIAEAEPGDASASVVLARADAAMYRAKQQGRNVVQA